MSKPSLTSVEYDSYCEIIEAHLRRESPEYSWFVERYDERLWVERQEPTVFSVRVQTWVDDNLVAANYSLSAAKVAHTRAGKQVLGKIRHGSINMLKDEIARVRS